MSEAVLMLFPLLLLCILISGLVKRKNTKLWIRLVIIILIVLLYLFGSYKLSKSRTVQLFGHIISHVDTKEKVVALTFDDGPTGHYTEEILEILDTYDIDCTFYLNGKDIEQHMSDASLIVSSGHEVGNHTYSHRRLMLMPYKQIIEEVINTDASLKLIGIDEVTTVRSPYCKKLIYFPLYLAMTDRINVTFSVEPQTYYQTAEEMTSYTVEETEPGDIILLHVFNEGNSEARKALPSIIEELLDEGYKFVTVSELISLDDN